MRWSDAIAVARSSPTAGTTSPPDDPLPHAWMEIGVHPAWRHHKIGYKLVGCGLIDRARAWYLHLRESRPELGLLWVGCATDEGSRVSTDLEENGLLKPQRWFFDAHRSLTDEPLPLVVSPPGIELRTFERAWSEKVRTTPNIAFGTRRARRAAGLGGVAGGDPDSRPDWSWIAVCTDDPGAEVVGYAVNCEIIERQSGWREGWTERIGVIPTTSGRAWHTRCWPRQCTPLPTMAAHWPVSASIRTTCRRPNRCSPGWATASRRPSGPLWSHLRGLSKLGKVRRCT